MKNHRKTFIAAAFGGLGLLAGCILLFITCLPLFLNTFDSRYLFFRAATAGVILALAGTTVGVYYAENKSEARRIGALVVILIGLTTGFLGLLTNKWWAESSPLSISVVFLREVPNSGSRFGVVRKSPLVFDHYDTYFLYKNTKHRFRTRQAVFGHVTPESTVKLPIITGFWGFDIIDLE